MKKLFLFTILFFNFSMIFCAEQNDTTKSPDNQKLWAVLMFVDSEIVDKINWMTENYLYGLSSAYGDFSSQRKIEKIENIVYVNWTGSDLINCATISIPIDSLNIIHENSSLDNACFEIKPYHYYNITYKKPENLDNNVVYTSPNSNGPKLTPKSFYIRDITSLIQCEREHIKNLLLTDYLPIKEINNIIADYIY